VTKEDYDPLDVGTILQAGDVRSPKSNCHYFEVVPVIGHTVPAADETDWIYLRPKARPR
jgi:hypothetical protein